MNFNENLISIRSKFSLEKKAMSRKKKSIENQNE